jgi:serine phosphatase RsbU (regulator of sigma subunit)
MKLREEIGDQQGLSSSLINIGLIYSEQVQFDSAQAYFAKALGVFRQLKDRKGEASALNNLGRIYTTLGHFAEALNCYRESLDLKRQMGNKEGECASLNNIGSMLCLQGKYREALAYSQQALTLADSIGSLPRKQEALETVSDIYTQLGDSKKALEAFRRYVAVRDEIMSREMQNKTLQFQTQYESDKKDQEIKYLNSERELQTTVRNVLVGGAVLLAGLLVLAFNRYRAANLANTELTRQKKLVEEQSRSIRAVNGALNDRNFELDQKNHEIMDSIFYAERIQRAVLPAQVPPITPVTEQFIVYKPRDIVSGDFYWAHTAETTEHGLISFVAAIDCTGHGVPGAFMSMIGNTLLNQIVLERRIYDPAKILEELNIAVRTALKQDTEEEEGERNSRDGMDVCLCRIEPTRAVFAGAKRPLYVVRPSVEGAECEEIKGDKHSIGGKQRTERPTFTNHEIAITQPITLYLTTDGFADQPNPAMLKYGSRRLKETLVDMAIFPAKRQRQSLLSELKQFQGSTDQRDDITIIGVKVKPPKPEAASQNTPVPHDFAALFK